MLLVKLIRFGDCVPTQIKRLFLLCFKLIYDTFKKFISKQIRFALRFIYALIISNEKIIVHFTNQITFNFQSGKRCSVRCALLWNYFVYNNEKKKTQWYLKFLLKGEVYENKKKSFQMFFTHTTTLNLQTWPGTRCKKKKKTCG